VVEALIWSAPHTLVVSLRLHALERMRASEELQLRCTPLLFALTFRRGARHVLSARLCDLGLSKDRKKRFALNMYLVEASLDPHIKRHRFREKCSR
jgi:hypothetical protein